MPSSLKRLATELARSVRGLWPRWGGHGHGHATTWLRLPGSDVDFAEEAGDLWLNSVVALGIGWKADRYSRPLLRVSKIGRDGDYIPLPRHPLVDLWNRPNGFYQRQALEAGLGLSLDCDGNGYVQKVRDGRGRVVNLFWQPHHVVEPTWPDSGEAFLDGFDIQVDSRTFHLPATEVVHVRRGIDPANVRKGIAPIKACLREAGVINREASFTLGLLKNSGVPGLAIIPDEENLDVTKDVADAIKERVRENFAGDQAGGAMVMQGRFKVVPVGFSPEQIRLDRLPASAVARVASAIGVSAMTLGLPDPNKTYSNMEEANRSAWASITAVQDRIVEALRWQLLPDFGTDPYTHVVEYDYSAIAELNEAQDQLHARVRDDYKFGLITKNEARELLGLEPDPDGDVFMPGTGGGEPVAEPGVTPGVTGVATPGADDDRLAALNGNGNGNGKAWRY